MLHNVDSVVNQSVHLRTDEKSQLKLSASQLRIINVLAAWATVWKPVDEVVQYLLKNRGILKVPRGVVW